MLKLQSIADPRAQGNQSGLRTELNQENLYKIPAYRIQRARTLNEP